MSTHTSRSFAKTRMRGSRRVRGRFGQFQRRPFRGQTGGRRRAIRKGNIRTGGLLQPDLKYYDTSQNADLGTALASVHTAPLTFNTVSQGDAANQRIGNKIVIKSIFVQGFIYRNDESSVSFGGMVHAIQYLLYLVVDHQTNGALITGANIIDSTSVADSMRNLEDSVRLTVLHKKLISRNLPAAVWDSVNSLWKQPDHIIPFSFTKKMNMLVTFNNASSNVASIVSNSIVLLAMYDTQAGTSFAPKIVYRSRIRFIG